jgi:hypothetical protein
MRSGKWMRSDNLVKNFDGLTSAQSSKSTIMFIH